MKIIFLGLGTNLGNRERNLFHAIEKISEHIGTILKSSALYETEPWGFESKDLFLNMAAMVETDLLPDELLQRILILESQLGRTRTGEHYSSRLIDIDILLYDDQVIDEKKLKIPHPLMHQRKFVLVPLCEIAPDVVHPVLKKTIKELLEACDDKSDPKKIHL